VTPLSAVPGSARARRPVNRNTKKISCFFFRGKSLVRPIYSEGVSDVDEKGGSWTLLTGHGHVLVEIARNPDARIRDISPAVGLTERTVQAIVADLEAAGYLTRTRIGRRTRYTVNPDSPFRHSAQDGLRVGPVLDQLTAMADANPPGPEAAEVQAGRSGKLSGDIRENPQQATQSGTRWARPDGALRACSRALLASPR